MLSGLDPLQPGDMTDVVDLITNGGFEAQGGSLTGWTKSIAGVTVTGPGGWVALQDSASPFLQYRLPLPSKGRAAAIADAANPRILTLRQVITIPSATSVMLGVDVLVMSGHPFATSDTFNLGPALPLSHQFRIDLVDPRRRPWRLAMPCWRRSIARKWATR